MDSTYLEGAGKLTHISDIDLVVTNDTYPLGSSKIPYFLRNMAQSLRKANVADNIVVIAKARVPIIKFVTTDGMSCGFSHPLYCSCCSHCCCCSYRELPIRIALTHERIAWEL